MRTTKTLSAAGAAALVAVAAAIRAEGPGRVTPTGTGPGGAAQPVDAGGGSGGGIADVIVCVIGSDLKEYTTIGEVSAYSMGTTARNVGNVLLSWRDSGQFADQHPVIAQNLYRLKGGRFEQIGLSWLKHGFCAADSSTCGSCANEPSCDWLGIGCADTYSSNLNGDFAASLGPRSEVNAATGEFVWPHSTPTGDNPGRLQVAIADLDPALNAGALYYGEAQYITPDDAGSGDPANNNSSYRRVTVGAFTGGIYNLSFTASTLAQQPAINAWQVADPGVALSTIDVPDDGRMILGTRVTDNGDGTWHYEYALLNMNSHRAARLFAVPVGPGAVLSDIGFHDVFYHSGEPYDGSDWPATTGAGAVTWSTVGYDPSADTDNALRWGTLYNFRFDADGAPVDVSATIGLYRTGTPSEVTVATQGPAPVTPPCPWDLGGDGQVGINDLLDLLGAWGSPWGINDLLDLLAAWGPCP
jgi:hypothetical protein